MKKCAAGIFLGLAALFLFTSCVSTELNSSKSVAKRLKIGWGKRSIAMEGPVPITGQFYLRVSHGSFTPVEASALVLEDSGDAVIFVSCDVVSVQKDVYNLVREFLRKEIPGFPVEKLIINATHTHAGPSTGNVSLSYPNKVKIIPSEKVQRFVARQIADAVKEAWNNRAEGSIAYGYGFATTGHSRRTIYLKDMGKTFKATSGTTVNGFGKMYGDTADAAFASYEAGTDTFINLLYTFDSKDRLSGAIINVPCPSQTNEDAWVLHASFWHNVREKLTAKYGAVGVIAQSAAAGDLSPRQLHYNQAEKRRYMLKYREKIASYLKNPMAHPAVGKECKREVPPDCGEVIELMRAEDIANRIVAAFDEVLSWAGKEKFSAPGIRHNVHTLLLARKSLPESIVEEEKRKHAASMKEKFMLKGDRWEMLRHNSRLNSRRRRMKSVGLRYEAQKKSPTLATDIHVVRIGNIAFATNRFELYMDYQHRIQARSPFEQTFIVQLTADAGGCGSYLATARGERNKGYSATAYSNQVSSTGGQQLVDATVQALKEVKKVPFRKNPAVLGVPRVKGDPAESDWERAAVLNRFCLADGSALSESSAEFRLLQSGEKLYLKVTCPAGKNVKKLILPSAGTPKRDGAVWQFESIEFFLAKGKEAYQFILSPEDCLMDRVISPFYRGSAVGWNCKNLQWGAKAADSGWSGFITIPLKELSFKEKGNNAQYRFNAYRTHYYVDKNGQVKKFATSYLAPEGIFSNISRFGTLNFAK